MSGEREPVDALDVERLAAQRGLITLFGGVTFSLAAGEALIVTGRNGSGKTTLLRIVAGLTAPFEGQVRWQKKLVRPFDARLRRTVAFSGHMPALKDELTTQENLAAIVELNGESAPASAIDEALDAVALDRQRALPIRVLSQGQKRRVSLARLYLSRRPLWILDEPLTALDTDGVAVLGTLLERHLDRGGLCIAASHQPLPVAASRTGALALDAVSA
ncbi:MAG TPA: cytochrome c biogenesis heme-transporting ATPase CcmA [Casimicrobiaceae bacterium]|nr:cytochrome c biogenesis heme-transporting ATPase CcmA [Casimicrobiaceae bacterium]